MKRSRSERRTTLDRPVIKRILDIKKDHPSWGYRRVWAYIRYRDGVVVGKNRIYRLMSEAKKLVPSNTQLKASRPSNRSKPRASVPNQFWGTDMTKIYVTSWGWESCSELKIKLKEDLVWPNEWTSPFQLQAALDTWVLAYNTDFPHQSLRYKTPAQFNQDFLNRAAARKEARSKIYSLSLA